SEDSEVYGVITFRNGWDGPTDTRGNGHGLYSQNLTGTKRIVDLISFDNYATGMKAFTEHGYVVGVQFEGNIIFNNGSSARPRPSNDRLDNIYIGSGINPAAQVSVINNYTYHPFGTRGPTFEFGYTAERNSDITIKNNYFVGGKTTLGTVLQWDSVVMSG